MTESFILCEGYHDRAFWGGLLQHAGCTDPGILPNGQRKPVLDPWGASVRGRGEHAFYSHSDAFIRVVPAGGKGNIPLLLANRLKQRRQKPLTHLVVNVDSDHFADGSPAVGATLSLNALFQLACKFDPAATLLSADVIELDGGVTHISLVRWETSDPMAPGVPNQHTLERLISAAIVSTYPLRGDTVQRWLDSRPAAPVAGPKSFAWSYAAGWDIELSSYEAYMASLWKDPLLVPHLEQRLLACGAMAIAKTLSA